MTLLGPRRNGFGKLSIFFDHLDTVDGLIFNILETSFLGISLFFEHDINLKNSSSEELLFYTHDLQFLYY